MKYYSIHNLLKIATNVDIPIPDYFKVDRPIKNPDLEVLQKPISAKRPKGNKLVRVSYYFWREKNKLFIDYGMANAKLLIENLIDNGKTRIQCTKTLKRFCTKDSWDSFIHGIILIKLIERGYTFIHAGALGYKRKEGVVIVAPADTGKTSTILSLLSTGNFGFMTDDTVPIGDGFVYAYPEKVKVSPYTLTGSMRFKGSWKRGILKPRLMGLMAERFLKMKVGKLHEVPKEFVVDKNPIRKVFLLGGHDNERKAREIKSMDVAGLLLLPSIEVSTLMHPYTELYYYAFNVNTSEILQKMKKVIENSLKNAECFELKSPSLGGYAQKIAEIMG